MARVTLGKYAATRYLFQLDERDLETAVYVIGSPNTGKSTLLGNLTEGFASLGHQGILVLDIKGDLAHEIAARTRHAGVRYELSRGFDDGQERFRGTVRYRTGPRGTPKEEQVLLLDWWADPVPGQREAIVASAADERFTLPVAEVYRRNQERYWDLMLGDGTSGSGAKQGDGRSRKRTATAAAPRDATARPGPVRPDAGEAAPAGDDPPRPPRAARNRPPSLLDEFPG